MLEHFGKQPNDPALHEPYDTIDEELAAWFGQLNMYLEDMETDE